MQPAQPGLERLGYRRQRRGPADKLPLSATLKIAKDLATNEIGADELARAKKPRVDTIQKQQLTNGYWVGELSGAQADPRRLDVIRQIVPGTEQVTAADVKRAAQQWLKPEAAYRLIVTPGAKTAETPAVAKPAA